ncbi:MAG: glycosyltransferase family 39 protein [Rhodobacteraceae bacterium]|nr:glycosyltransferase family 39 protein [Paracoccaceae bacterium]
MKGSSLILIEPWNENAFPRVPWWAWLTMWGFALAALYLRLHDLGAVGLYSDEKYTFMSALAVLERGTPELPSGMLYPRAMFQTYLMAASVAVLGESEFAFRLPSALVGALCVPVAFLLGVRRLVLPFALLFAAVAAFLPQFVEISQIARMYIFLVFFVFLYLYFCERWAVSGHWVALAGACVSLLFAIETHVLAIFALPVIVIISVSQPTRVRLVQALAVAVLAVGFYVFMDAFISEQYAGTVRDLQSDEMTLASAGSGVNISLVLALMIGVVAMMAFLFTKFAPPKAKSADFVLRLTALAGMGAAFVAALGLAWIPAVLLFVFSAALHLFVGGRPNGTIIAACVMFVLFLGQVAYLAGAGDLRSLSDLLHLMFAYPSPTPLIRFVMLFPAAFVLAVFCFSADLLAFARGRPAPLHLALVLGAVLLPMLMMGVIQWSIPPRYMYGLLPVFLFCLFLSAQGHMETLTGIHASAARARLLRPAARNVVAALLLISLVSPAALSHALQRDYEKYPDHKGAAMFLRSLEIQPTDVVMVLDAPIQTYYLGRVDYLLRQLDVAAWQVRQTDSGLSDIFTGTPLVHTSEKLLDIIRDPYRGDMYLIGSGEISGEEAERRVLGDAILRVLEQEAQHTVFVGRDGLTKIWKFPPPEAKQSMAERTDD